MDSLDPEHFEQFAKLVFDAVNSKNWALVASLAVVLVVYLARRFLGPKLPFIQTDRGGALLSLVVSFAGAAANALLAGAPFSGALLLKALTIALTASGGFAIVRKLLWGDAEKAKADAKAAGEAAKASVAPAAAKSPMDIVNGK